MQGQRLQAFGNNGSQTFAHLRQLAQAVAQAGKITGSRRLEGNAGGNALDIADGA
jgi:hypothetical protein